MALSSISIRKALKSVASENYDKTNIFYFFILSFIAGLISAFSPQKPKTEDLPLFGLCLLLTIIFSLVVNGIYTLASNNAINRKKGVFPNPLKDFAKIIITSLCMIVGNIFWSIVMLVVTAAFMIPIMFVNKIAAIIVSAIPLLCLATLFIGAYFNFVTSLSITDWFDFKKAWNFMKEAKSYFLAYFIKTIAMGLIVGSIVFVLMLLMAMLAALLKGAGSHAIVGLIMFFYSFVCVAASVYMVDLTAQFVRQAKKMNVKPKKVVQAGV